MYRFATLGILSVLCGLLLFALFYLYMTRKFNYWKVRGVSYFKPSPFTGNFKELVMLQTTVGELLQTLYNKTAEPFVGLYVFSEPYLLIRSPELIKSVLVKDFYYFADRSVTPNEKSDPVGSNMLFLLKNPDWKILRNKLTPMFTSGKLKNMFYLMDAVGKDLREYVRNVVLKKDEADAKELSTKYSTDMIASCAFGLNAHSFEQEDAQFRSIGKRCFKFTVSRAIQMMSYFFFPLLVELFGFKFLESSATKYLTSAFNDTMKQRKTSEVKRNDIVDMLIEMNEKPLQGLKMTMEGDRLVAQAAMFILGAFETTSTTISTCLYELCLNPHIQTKLRQEIRRSLSKNDGKLSLDVVNDITYLDMVISETLRKYPALPFLDRRTIEDYKIPGSDVIIEKGVPILISLIGLHYDPQYFPDPDKFDPERFSKENAEKLNPYCYLPFGKGPRNCLAGRFGVITTKLGIINIISEFEVEKSKNTMEHLVLDPKGLVTTSINGFPMRFKDCIQ